MLEGQEAPLGTAVALAVHERALRVVSLPHRALDRDRLSDELAARGVACSVHFIPLHHLTYYRASCRRPVPLDGAERVFPELLSLPMYPAITDEEVGRVCSVLTDLLSPTRQREVIA